MQITHYCNSFISAAVNKTLIVCDPWVGSTDITAWLSYPICKNGVNILNDLNPNFIYISHLHYDHFDKNLLSKFKNKKVKIIIKRYSDQRLKKKILAIGFHNIIECEQWKKYKLNRDVSIAVIPQLSSNTSEIPEQINYDLDTSILIQSNHSKEVFFNNVDNPLSLNDLKKVKNFSKKYLKSKIDIACFPLGAASEYPQCFLNVNRKKEKEKIIRSSLTDIKLKLRLLQPKIFFQAGGTYVISGKYSVLNKYIAQPSENQIRNFLKNENYKVFNIEGGGKIIKKNGEWLSKINKFSKIKSYKKKIIKKYTKQDYFYLNIDKNISLDDIDQTYLKSYENYKTKINNFLVKTKWKVEFCIYKNLSINSKGKINLKESNLLKKYILKHYNYKNKTSKNNYTALKCHLDFNLFYGLLKKKYAWNQTLSGSLILYERKPNKFDPNLSFSLNFLVQ